MLKGYITVCRSGPCVVCPGAGPRAGVRLLPGDVLVGSFGADKATRRAVVQHSVFGDAGWQIAYIGLDRSWCLLFPDSGKQIPFVGFAYRPPF